MNIGLLLFLAAVPVSSTYNLIIPKEYYGPGQYTIKVVDPSEIDQYCGEYPASVKVFGCYENIDKTGMPMEHSRIITLDPCLYPEAKNPDSYARLICHEKAHAKGWVHSQ